MTIEGSGSRVRGSGFPEQEIPRRGWIAVSVVLACLIAGCGGSPEPSGGRKSPEEDAARLPRSATRTRARSRPTADKPATESPPSSESEEEEGTPRDWPEPRRAGSLGDLLNVPDAASRWIPDLAPLKVDEARTAAAGIRKLTSKRLTLYTDLPPDEEIDVLPEVFDRAFPQWCERFGIDAADHSDWRMTGFLIREKLRFRDVGLLPDDLPPFQHGYSRNYELWLCEQPSSYYRRHLLLHEGTHGFMNTLLGGCGPPWYMEGIAELMGTHRWHEGRLTMNYLPASPEQVPRWGRIEMIKDDFAARRAKTLKGVVEYGQHAHLDVEPYAWCWAAATLLDRHPRYQERFRQLHKRVLEPDFSDRFRKEIVGDDWDALAEQWQVFIADLEYGHDIPGTIVDFTPGQPPADAGMSVRVAADRGWQNSGLRLRAGVTYRLRASGRYQVADQPQIWWCEPGGVSIRYYKGRPLGVLLAAVRPEQPPVAGPSALIRPIVVGLGKTLTPRQTGTLFLRINDSAGELDDNSGELAVQIRPEPGD